MEFHVKGWSDLIALRLLLRASLCFFCRKEPILSTAIVTRPARAGMKATKPLFILKEGEVVFEKLSIEPISLPERLEEFCARDSFGLGIPSVLVFFFFFNLFPCNTILGLHLITLYKPCLYCSLYWKRFISGTTVPTQLLHIASMCVYVFPFFKGSRKFILGSRKSILD